MAARKTPANKPAAKKAKPAAKPAAKKAGVGRATVYRPEMCEPVRRMCAMFGATIPQIAQFLGVSTGSVNNWIAKYPAFKEAVKQGGLTADELVERRLFERATGYNHPAVKIFMPAGASAPVYAPYTEHCPPDVTAGIFWLKNRQKERWRDKIEHEHGVASGLAELLKARRERVRKELGNGGGSDS